MALIFDALSSAHSTACDILRTFKALSIITRSARRRFTLPAHLRFASNNFSIVTSTATLTTPPAPSEAFLSSHDHSSICGSGKHRRCEHQTTKNPSLPATTHMAAFITTTSL